MTSSTTGHRSLLPRALKTLFGGFKLRSCLVRADSSLASPGRGHGTSSGDTRNTYRRAGHSPSPDVLDLVMEEPDITEATYCEVRDTEQRSRKTVECAGIQKGERKLSLGRDGGKLNQDRRGKVVDISMSQIHRIEISDRELTTINKEQARRRSHDSVLATSHIYENVKPSYLQQPNTDSLGVSTNQASAPVTVSTSSTPARLQAHAVPWVKIPQNIVSKHATAAHASHSASRDNTFYHAATNEDHQPAVASTSTDVTSRTMTSPETSGLSNNIKFQALELEDFEAGLLASSTAAARMHRSSRQSLFYISDVTKTAACDKRRRSAPLTISGGQVSGGVVFRDDEPGTVLFGNGETRRYENWTVKKNCFEESPGKNLNSQIRDYNSSLVSYSPYNSRYSRVMRGVAVGGMLNHSPHSVSDELLTSCRQEDGESRSFAIFNDDYDDSDSSDISCHSCNNSSQSTIGGFDVKNGVEQADSFIYRSGYLFADYATDSDDRGDFRIRSPDGKNSGFKYNMRRYCRDDNFHNSRGSTYSTDVDSNIQHYNNSCSTGFSDIFRSNEPQNSAKLAMVDDLSAMSGYYNNDKGNDIRNNIENVFDASESYCDASTDDDETCLKTRYDTNDLMAPFINGRALDETTGHHVLKKDDVTAMTPQVNLTNQAAEEDSDTDVKVAATDDDDDVSDTSSTSSSESINYARKLFVMTGGVWAGKTEPSRNPGTFV